ncbi:MAG: prepilin-type N-terminal cleavage/methylation domain-containing protein [Gammaproteobacteria bacterium]|nr:prepilin-type N-terminal cleavage/methylation domain-containing protein [Gammaproteobacteria bacterium]
MRDRTRGFSLLEAIVALTIVAITIMGAYAWVAGNIISLTRVRDLALEEAALQQALGALEQTDLGRQPAGSIQWREFRIDWQAEPIEATRPSRTGVGGTGRYDLTLYRVLLSVSSHERLIGTPELRMVQHSRSKKTQGTP